MIIDKVVLTEEEKRELETIEETYRTNMMGETGYGNSERLLKYYKKRKKKKRDIEEKAKQRYILSFSGRVLDVLDDVKEILSAITKEDFEKYQDLAKASILEESFIDDMVPEIYNFDSKQSESDAIRILKDINRVCLKLAEKKL
jgi:hypothetical protein